MDDLKFDIALFNGETVEARWPTDDEWKARQRGRNIIVRSLGRGATETDVLGGEEADLTLLQAITESAKPIDKEEASILVANLEFAEVTNLEPLAGGFRVTLQTFQGELVFEATRPTAAQVKRNSQFARRIDHSNAPTEIKVNLDVPAGIFDELCAARKDVSIIYKRKVVEAVIAEAQRLLEPSVRP